MRTVIYARFSSTLQNSRSIDDQVRICRERSDREGWEIVDVFTDYAISGAAGIGEEHRPGLSAMLTRVDAGGIDQVLTEATDRLARHQGDSYAIRERLTYAGARLFTLADGEVNDITGTLKSLMDAQFRTTLAAKIRRGQRGTVASGRSPAGLAYGYRKANRLDARGELIRGLREIDAEQAAIVLRIFSEYAAGDSPRAIAERLNAEEIKGPSGHGWRTSTINGDRIRRNGMLQNRIYRGEIVHNRTRKVIHPVTRKELIKPNPESEWIVEPVEALRIVPQDIWDQVERRRATYDGKQPEKARRPKHLFSGLARCGVCGGGYSIVSRHIWGCGRWRDGRACSNNRTITTPELERRVLAGLVEHMLDPDLVAIYVAEYHRDFAKRSREFGRDRANLEKRARDADAKIQRLVSVIAEGGGEFTEFRGALAAARAEQDAAKLELSNLQGASVVALHPHAAADYREQVAALNEALAGNPATRAEAIPQIRSLIDRITISPKASRGTHIDVEGRLNSILQLAAGQPLSDIYSNGRAGSGDRTRITSLEG